MKWYSLLSKIRPLATLASLSGFELHFDGDIWWINGAAYELLYFAKGPWWFFRFKDCQSGRKESFRILFCQLSKRDHWQISLLFQLYRF
jgi:hypothetical protein